MPKVEIKSKLVLKDIGNPKKAAASFSETVKKVPLGIIIGIADKKITRKAANGIDFFEGLGGTFEGRPADETADTVQSGVCFLPEGIQNTMFAQLVTTDDEGREVSTGAQIQFAYRVSVVEASNPQGYSWSFEPLLEPVQSDPLSALRGEIEKKALPAPETPKGKGK